MTVRQPLVRVDGVICQLASGQSLPLSAIERLTDGVYTPTPVGVDNVTSAVGVSTAWMRVGDTVSMSGRLNVTPTVADTTTIVEFPVPVPSLFTSGTDASGDGAIFNGSTGLFGSAVINSISESTLRATFRSISTTTHQVRFSITYPIIGEITDPPVNTAPPVVSGAAFVGDTATATTGTWTNSPTSYSYQWQVYDEGEDSWEDVTGETASTFEDIQDEGEYRVQVVASNAVGASDPAYSAPFVITESSGVPGYVNSANNGSLYYDGATPTSITLNGVTSGNSLLLVITGLNDGASSNDGMEPASLSNPIGASWGAPVLHRSQDAFGSADQSGLIMYLAHGVSAGNHTITAGWPTDGYVGMTLIELENVSSVVASGSAGADNTQALPNDMGCATSGNVSAGDCVAIAAVGLGHGWYGQPVTGDVNFTQRHAGANTYASGLVESRVFNHAGGAPVAWTANRPAGGGNGATEGWASGIVVLR